MDRPTGPALTRRWRRSYRRKSRRVLPVLFLFVVGWAVIIWLALAFVALPTVAGWR